MRDSPSGEARADWPRRHRGERRQQLRQHDDLSDVEEQGAPDNLSRVIELGRCLQRAREICPPEELDVLLAKLSGLALKEIGAALKLSAPQVDHRFRNAVARLQQDFAQRPQKQGGKDVG